MIGDYDSLTNFIKTVVLQPGLKFNQLKTTTSAVNSVINAFGERGWTAVEIAEEPEKSRRYRIISPDRHMELVLNSSKVSRHPLHTEQICQRKHLTKRMLDLRNLPSPPGADFSRREKGVAKAYFQEIPKPVVVKPTSSGGSHGVTIGVSTLDEFEQAWKLAIEEGGPYSNVLIEQFVRGVELRAFVVGDDAVSIVARVQPFVVGDGVTGLGPLIHDAIEQRKVHYRATQLGIVIDWNFLEKQGYSHESVPGAGDIVFLSPLALPAGGALLIDVTAVVSPDLKRLAVAATQAVPGLEVGGIDILVADLFDASNAVILEVNTAPSLNLHRFVTHGQPRDVELDVVEYFHQRYLDDRNSAPG